MFTILSKRAIYFQIKAFFLSENKNKEKCKKNLTIFKHNWIFVVAVIPCIASKHPMYSFNLYAFFTRYRHITLPEKIGSFNKKKFFSYNGMYRNEAQQNTNENGDGFTECYYLSLLGIYNMQFIINSEFIFPYSWLYETGYKLGLLDFDV